MKVSSLFPVSYTHLDVYKRQVWSRAIIRGFGCGRASSTLAAALPEETVGHGFKLWCSFISKKVTRCLAPSWQRYIPFPSRNRLRITLRLLPPPPTNSRSTHLVGPTPCSNSTISPAFFSLKSSCNVGNVAVTFLESADKTDNFPLYLSCLLYTSRCV